MAAAAAILASAQEELDLEDFEVPTSFWDKSFNLRGALGYKDNVLLSNNRPDESAFWQTSLDFSLFGFSLDNGVNFTLFASFEDRRYFSSDELDKEQLAIAQARLEKPFAEVWKSGASFQYFYIDQVFDASATEDIFFPLPVQAHRLGLSPFVSRQFPRGYSLELQFNVDRQLYNQPLDDFWEYGPKLSLEKKYGHRSTANISYALQQRDYDTRPAFDSAFSPVPGSSLRYLQHELESSLNHSWDKQRRWRSRVRLGFEYNLDNGSGYFDYRRYRVSNRFGYYQASWNASLEGKYLQYDYLRQPAGDGNSIRALREYIVSARLEKNLLKNLKIYAESEHEWARSNFQLEEYQVNTILAGVDWEF